MPKKKNATRSQKRERKQAGQTAKASSHTLRSYTVGAAPIINRLLDRMQLEKFFKEHLPPDGPRTKLPTSKGLLLLLRNFLFSREPIYGVGEWADAYAPDLLGLTEAQRGYLSDDTLGRCTDCLFMSNQGELVLDVVRHVIKEFCLHMDELHNDSTTVSFFGAYSDAAEEGLQRGQHTVAITYGHSKAHRPDLKQLLYVLTVTEDGGVPVYFSTKSGNVTDDTTHQETWELLCQLVGRKDFLYVADCKLATMENMSYIAGKQGRFVSVLPATRKEDHDFRKRLAKEADPLLWEWLYDIRDEDGEVCDELSVWPRETLTAEGFRLWWFHSTRKAELDAAKRIKQIDRAVKQLNELRGRLGSPRTRFRTREKVQKAVDGILDDVDVRPWMKVSIQSWCTEKYRQTKPGRPGKDTEYVKVEVASFDLSWEIDAVAMAQERVNDGVFPLVTNDKEFSALETIQAYKRQPVIEKRFSQLKTDFAVAPVYLKNVSRIQALMCIYFFAMLVQTLLERELRAAMQATYIDSLPLYPEGRACKAPTTRRVLEVFEPIQRHTLSHGGKAETFVTDLSSLQKKILKLLDIPSKNYGHP